MRPSRLAPHQPEDISRLLEVGRRLTDWVSVFDGQHGTAIIITAGLRNAQLTDRRLGPRHHLQP